jgi:hypothetical protein
VNSKAASSGTSAGLADGSGAALFGVGVASWRVMRVEEKLRVEMNVHLSKGVNSTFVGDLARRDWR